MDETKTNETTTTETKIEERKKYDHIVFEIDHKKFDSDATSTFLTTDAMKGLIDDLFHTIFTDYIGCEICVNDSRQNQMDVISRTIQPFGLYVELLFRENKANGLKLLAPVRENKTGDKLSRLESMCGPMSARAYMFNPDASVILAKLLPHPYGAMDYSKSITGEDLTEEDMYSPEKIPTVNWVDQSFEEHTQISQSMFHGMRPGYSITVHVTGFPLETILALIYGDCEETESGKKKKAFTYGCHVVKKINNNPFDRASYLIQITRLRDDVVNKLFKACYSNNIPNMGGYYGNPMVNASYIVR